MLHEIIAGLLAVGQVAAQSSASPPAATPPPANSQVDLHGIAQGIVSANKVPVAPADKCASSGAALGTVLGVAGGFLPGGAGLLIGALPVGSLLSGELLKILDCKEQKQAATATNEAIRGGVGSQVTWKSESRKNVSGLSKVTAEEHLASGAQCMTVTDVVIIDGQETTVGKKMCRAPGATAFVRA